QFAQDFFSIKHGEVGRKLCLNQTFFNYLRMGGPGQTGQ
ncbi:unnamed protein product, partial [marine sediment metagenome]